MGWNSIDINGKRMWEDSEGQRLKQPFEEPDKYGWHKIDVNGKIMWENSDGERAF